MLLVGGINKKRQQRLNFFLICNKNGKKIDKQIFCKGQKSEEITALSVIITVKVNESTYGFTRVTFELPSKQVLTDVSSLFFDQVIVY